MWKPPDACHPDVGGMELYGTGGSASPMRWLPNCTGGNSGLSHCAVDSGTATSPVPVLHAPRPISTTVTAAAVVQRWTIAAVDEILLFIV